MTKLLCTPGETEQTFVGYELTWMERKQRRKIVGKKEKEMNNWKLKKKKEQKATVLH